MIRKILPLERKLYTIMQHRWMERSLTRVETISVTGGLLLGWLTSMYSRYMTHQLVWGLCLLSWSLKVAWMAELGLITLGVVRKCS